MQKQQPLLPLEIYREILRHVTQSDQLNCRLAAGQRSGGSGGEKSSSEGTEQNGGGGDGNGDGNGRLLYIAATEAAFRHFHLDMSPIKSAYRRYRFIAIENPELRGCVREVTMDFSSWSILREYGEEEERLGSLDFAGFTWQEKLEQYTKAKENFDLRVFLLARFSNLVNLHLQFSGDCNSLSDDSACDILRTIFEQLAAADTDTDADAAIRLRCLTIENLPGMRTTAATPSKDPTACAIRRGLAAQKQSLTDLRLCIAPPPESTEYGLIQRYRHAYTDQENLIKERQWVDSVANIPSIWLQPEVSHNLRVLSLYSSDPLGRWGWWPRMDQLRKVELPNLRVLALGNYVFSHEWQVKWIAGLGSEVGGLRELYLDLCSILWYARYPDPDPDPNDDGAGEGEHGNTAKGDNEHLFGYPPPSAQYSEPWNTDDIISRFYPLRWHLVFENWRENMKSLEVFRMGYGLDSRTDDLGRKLDSAVNLDSGAGDRGGPFRNYDEPYLREGKFGKGGRGGMETTAREVLLTYTFFDVDLRIVPNNEVAKGYVDKDWSNKGYEMIEPGLEDFGVPDGEEYDERDVAYSRYQRRKFLDEEGLLDMKRRFPFPDDSVHIDIL